MIFKKKPLSIKELINKTKEIDEKINSFNLKMKEITEMVKEKNNFICKND